MKTVEYVKKEIAKIDSHLEQHEPAYTTALILLSALIVGADVKRIAKFTHLPRREVQKRAWNLRRSGIWQGSKALGSWNHYRNGATAFWCDIAVAQGFMTRK